MLLKWVFKYVRMHQPSSGGFFRLYPHVSDGAGSVAIMEVLSEGDPRRLAGSVAPLEVPVAFVSRYLTNPESRSSHILATVGVVHWSITRCKRFLSFASRLEVVVPSSSYVLAVRGVPEHLRLQALLVDMSTYNPSWVVGSNQWVDPTIEPSYVVADSDASDQPCPQVAHEAVTITMPAAHHARVDIPRRSNLLVTFDGGAAGKKGTGGFLVWGPDAELL